MLKIPLHLFAAAFVLAAALHAAAPVMAAGGGGDSYASDAESDAYKEGRQAVEAKRFEQAVKVFARVTADEPDNPDAWNLFAFSLRKLKRFDEAERHYLKALRLDPRHLGANEYLGELYLQTNRLAKAEERLTVLDRACLFGCAEYSELKAAIEAFKKTGTVPGA